MTGLARAKVGWCPGALRPMATGDGVVLRIKPRGGILTLEQAEAIADLAAWCGNGALDLTGRSNLQIRGARPETIDTLVQHLADFDLLDADAEAEAVRNLVASPLAGLLPPPTIDIRPIVAALGHRLRTVTALHRLPAKWSILVDDGGPLSLTGVAADIRFEAASDGRMVVGLADDAARASCAPEDVADVAEALGRLALEPRPQRMTDLVAVQGTDALFTAAALRRVATQSERRPAVTARQIAGRHGQRGVSYIGLAAPFGSLQAGDLRRLAQRARLAGALDLRLTPWRTILATSLDGGPNFALPTADLGFITDPDDPRLAIAACRGGPACHRGTTAVPSHAEILSATPWLSTADGIAIHVSGCSKGCAHPAAAPWTLVGRDGLYDIVRHGKAGDGPVARALSFQDAAVWLSREACEERT